MPPRTRTRATKILKENIEVVKKLKSNSSSKVQNKPRKALADKTNSLSDDNASVDVPIKPTKIAKKRTALRTKNAEDNVRPRRERRLPTRYVENDVLINLSKSKDATITSLETPNKSTAKRASIEVVSTKNTVNVVELAKARPTRQCRLQSVKEKPNNVKPNTPDKCNKTISPFKTPTTNLENSLVVNRPKRICRLPSKFEDHSISPNKFIPVQPCHASTPKVQTTETKAKQTTKLGTRTRLQECKEKESRKQSLKITPTKTTLKQTTLAYKRNPDTNNNAKYKTPNRKSPTLTKSPTKSTKILTKKISPTANKKSPTKRIINNNFSFRILEDKPKSNDNNEDIYEFTYDPNEEPAPQKKKRKRIVKKKPPKPKTYILKNNYDQNVSKALEALKTKVKPGTSQPIASQTTQIAASQITQPTAFQPTQATASQINQPTAGQTTQPTGSQTTQLTADQSSEPTVEKVDAVVHKVDAIVEKVAETIQKVTPRSKPQNTQLTAPEIPDVSYAPALQPLNESAKTSIHESNYASIRVEDIAADFELTSDNHDDLNYSPISTPCRPNIPENQSAGSIHSHVVSRHSIANRDPLNLQGNLSFFEEQPVASSSMNVSIRHPTASPWRVEFGSLPIKWHANTYVKANMTPAVESSFIASEDFNKKKHVYTNLVPEADESLHKLETNAPNLVQTSIISFIKEVAERSAKKRERGRSTTPTKANSLFEDVPSSTEFGYKTPKKARKDKVVATPNVSNDSNKSSKDTSKESNLSEQKKKKEKKKDKDCTYFGFDDSENQENTSPIKEIKAPNERVRALRPRARAVLQEINSQGPTRSILPVAKKLPSSEVVDQMYEQLKSAEDAQLPEKDTTNQICATNIEDEESVHLFEDIEFVHHLKQHRKSYGKAQKVTFRQNSLSDSDDTQQEQPRVSDDEYDDLADLTFQMPKHVNKKITKKKAKKQLTKKEEKEVEEWAAGFNSMCEDIDEYTLVVE